LDALWVDRVPTANEYSQLVTPQAIYFVHELIKRRNLSYDLNWFRPWINAGGVSFSMLFRTFRAFGVRYLGGYEPLRTSGIPGVESFQSTSFPRRQPGNPPGRWVIHELPDINLGNYSPTEATVVRSAAEMIAALAAPNFDFTRQAVLSTEIRDQLVPARDMKLVCDPRRLACFGAQRRHVGTIDSDTSFDYGIFSPACRRGDFADMKQLGIKLAGP
jgi:hypothetical protein